MNKDLNDREVLLVTEKESNKLRAVTGMKEDGTLRTVPPKQENESEFLKIDRHGNMLENFFSNFMRQAKEPTHFHFFKTPVNMVEKIASALQKLLKEPEKPSNKEMLDQYRVLPEEFSKKEAVGTEPSRINWEQFEKIGVTQEQLQKNGALEKMLLWQKSPSLIPIRIEIGDTVIRTDARLALKELPDGKISLKVHAIRNEPDLDRPFMGVKFTDEDKKNLLKTGNAGRLIEIEPVKDQKIMAFVSVDKLTNELVALRADKINIPNELNGVALDDKQKQALAEGKAVRIVGMVSKQGKEYNATVQFNADRRRLDYTFDNVNRIVKEQKRDNPGEQGRLRFRIPEKLLGIELNKEQQNNLREHKTIYVSGMIDKKGEPFNAYVKVNAEEGKLNFYKWNPDKAKKVIPDNNSKTQVAVNSEGKTNEATKKIEEPLKKGQATPNKVQKEKDEAKKENKRSAAAKQEQPKKNKGIKR